MVAPLTIVIAGAGLLAIMSTQNTTEAIAVLYDDLRKTNVALETVERAQELEKVVSLHAEAGGQRIESLGMAGIPVSELVVPALDISAADLSRYGKFRKAVDDYYESNPATVTPACADLAATGRISQEDCDIVESKTFEHYRLENGRIVFKVEDDIKVRLDRMPALAQSTGTDGEFYSVPVDRNNDAAKIGMIVRKTTDLQAGFAQSLDNKNYPAAARLSYHVSRWSPFSAQQMNEIVARRVLTDANLSADDVQATTEFLARSTIVIDEEVNHPEIVDDGEGSVTVEVSSPTAIASDTVKNAVALLNAATLVEVVTEGTEESALVDYRSALFY